MNRKEEKAAVFMNKDVKLSIHCGEPSLRRYGTHVTKKTEPTANVLRSQYRQV